MALVLNEDQQQLKDQAHAFVQAKSPVTAFRKLRDEKEQAGFDRALWKEMAELGWAGIIFPEQYGGVDFGYTGLGVVLEEMGRTLTASPIVSTVLTCGTAVLLAGSEEQKSEILPAIASGDRVLALALEETPHHSPSRIATSAAKAGDGFRIDGEKTFVVDGHVADQLIVAARTAGGTNDKDGITLFLVDGDARGVTRVRTRMVDNRNAANIALDGVEVGADAVLGEVGQGFPVLEETLDRARIGLSAEMLGSILAVWDLTLDYLKERKQFGVPIGSFQALKHRAADMFCEVELSKSVVLDALSAIDERRNDVPQVASLAKAKLCETFELVSNEGIQMHGGIGMTDEHDVGLYLKRARVAQATFGDARFHRDRYAAMEGY